jgi:hypothetical protein
MSETQALPESILVADCGSTTTKVVLLDTVDSQYRFVAYAESLSTVHTPWEDLSVGVADAIRTLQETVGRTLVDQNNQLITPERPDGSGVDCLLVVSSAAPPLRLILAGLTRDVSLASARRAALSTYAQIEDVIALEQGLIQGQPRTDDEKINAIWHKSPDLILLVGGTDGGTTAPVLDMIRNVLRVALYLMGENAPPVIYAGNAELRDEVTQLLEGLSSLQITDNVRPLPDVENIGPAHEEIEVVFYEQNMRHLAGMDVLDTWSASAALPTARAADYAIRYCERARESSKPALSVNIGSASVTINMCHQQQPLTTLRSDLGVGHGLASLLEQVQMRDILRWLPFEITETQARDWLMNKLLRASSIPQTPQELLLEQAVAREALRLTLRDSLPGWPGQSGRPLTENMIPPCDPLVGGGGVLAHAPYHGHAALVLLDALQPTWISALYLDEFNLLPSLGMVATINPLATVQTLHNGGLTFLGTVVAPMGRAQPGETALTICPVDKATSARFEVAYGDLEAIPFQFSEPGAMLELTPTRGFDIGLGPGKSVQIPYAGGTVGLIVDARGRPIEFSSDPRVQRQRVDRWLWEMTSA